MLRPHILTSAVFVVGTLVWLSGVASAKDAARLESCKATCQYGQCTASDTNCVCGCSQGQPTCTCRRPT
jgi:hypothetical protein